MDRNPKGPAGNCTGDLTAGADIVIKGGWTHHVVHFYQAEMAQNFWAAIYAFSACFIITVLVSLATQRTKTDDELKGLVYSLTPRIREHEGIPWYKQPATLACIVLVVTIALNIIFW